MAKKVYEEMAQILTAIENCKKSNNETWLSRYQENLEQIIEDFLPHGSGIDSGVKISEKAKSNKIVLEFGYHHMNENGFYNGWTYHELIITPNLAFGYDVRMTGPDKSNVKDYLYEAFDYALTQEIVYNLSESRYIKA